MPTARVIDLSHHNVIPESLVAARQAGVWGIIHKASEGTNFVDSKLAARADLARDAGMLFGVYHFIRPGKIHDQAMHFCRTLIDVSDIHTLVALDYEDADVSLSECREWIAAVEDTVSRKCVLYSGHVLKEKVAAGEDPGYLVDRRLWLAQYGPKAELPKGWSSYWLWQYTDQGSVPGVSPPTDLNDYEGSLDQLEEEWSGRMQTTPIEPPEPVVTDAHVGIVARGSVTVVVNGYIVYPPSYPPPEF